MRRLRLATGLALVCLGPACGAPTGTSASSDAGVDDGSIGDASTMRDPVVGVTRAHATVARVRAALAVEPAIANRFDATVAHLEIRDQRVVSVHDDSTKQGSMRGAPKLYARGDAWADAPVTLGVGGHHNWTSDWSIVGAAHVAASIEAGRVVYPNALPSSDVVVAGAEDALETFVVERDAGAPRELRFHIARSPSVVGHQVEPSGAIALVDAEQLAVVRISPAFAIDAAGKRAPVPMRMERDDLVLTLDPTGLAYPIVVDPAVTTAVWSYRTNSLGKDTFISGNPATCTGAAGCALTCKGGIIQATLAFSPQLGRVVSAGGNTDAPCSDTAITGWYDWDSLHGTWLKGPATFAPPATARYAMTGAQTSQDLVALFGYASGALGDGYFHDGSNWYSLCNSTGTGTCTSLTTGGSVTCPHCLGGAPASTARYYAAGGYVAGNFVVYGGSGTGGTIGDTCYGTSFPLTCSTPATTPGVRTSAGSAVDSTRGRLVVFGGNNGAGWIYDTWEWAPSTGWVAKCGTGTTGSCGIVQDPVGMMFDAARGVTVMIDDTFATWEWNGTSWAEICYGGSCGPTSRNFPSLGWDSVTGRGVLAGGYSPGAGYYDTDTWEYHVRGNSCAQGCDTGNCVDGVCCEQPLCAACQSCGQAGNPGVCTTVTSADDPDSCPSTTSTCNAAGVCTSKLGIACTSPSQCATGNCVASTTGSVCCSASSCLAGQLCQVGTGACIGDLGFACGTNGALCASGNCVDGVCCDSACDPSKPCQACNAAGHCVPVNGAPPSTRTACPTLGSGDASCNKATCNGSDIAACHYPGSSTTCSGTSICSGSIEYDASGCNGAGDCAYSTAKSCGVFGCVGGACKASCATNTDCASGFFCNAGACVALEGAGAPCTQTSQCAQGTAPLTCTDGVCCTSATCAPTGTCNGSHAGTCTLANGQPATSGSQCTSGILADGVCCNSVCTGQCEACNVAGSAGTCVPRPNGTAPAAGHGACGTVSSDPTCGVETCDGSTRTSCTATIAGTVCGSNACSTGIATTIGKCDGAGKCTGQQSLSCAPYACAATACKTSCTTATEATDCASGYYCGPSSKCIAKEVTGAPCTATDQCVSSFCVGAPGASVCCDAACTTTGYSCSVPGAVGHCTKGDGTACVLGSECGSGNCVDGYCCNSACSGTCQACDATGSVGTCVSVSGAPHGTTRQAACTGGTGACANSCNGSDALSCHLPGNTVTCSAASCGAGAATTAGQCDGAGHCGTQTTSCAPYAGCSGALCSTTCAADTDCVAGNFCSGGHCVAKAALGSTCVAGDGCASTFCANGVCCDAACTTSGFACNVSAPAGHCAKTNGTACAASTECASGNCVDGVCCNTACATQCEACDVSGAVGTCLAVTGAPHATASPARASCPGSGTCGAACNGADTAACHYPGASLACGTPTCASGLSTAIGTCDGTGACKQAQAACSPYLCATNACNTTCAVDTDCVTGTFCSAGRCSPELGLGSTCSGNDACQSGFCVGGTCCNSACTTSGFACNLPGSLGTCSKGNGTPCGASSECASGNCVDGVCCNSACTGQCQACDVSGSAGSFVGTCTGVSGAPHGKRAACAAGGAAGCGLTCNPSQSVTACSYPQATTSCGANTCVDSATQDATFTTQGTCDGKGDCTSGAGDCGAYECTSSNGGCKTACLADNDCSSGNFCSSGKCVPLQGLGVPCTDPTQCPKGQCVDGVCCGAASCGVGASCAATTATAGHCTTLQGFACVSNGQCASGFCVDGVCCDRACTGSCEACAESAHVGTCVPVVGATRGNLHPPCASPGFTPDPACGLSCNGTDASQCHFATTTSTCGTPSCNAGAESDVSTCDGGGHCKPLSKACAPYVCGATACKTVCAVDADCTAGTYCASGVCVPTQTLATTCTSNDQCASGFCTDGVCCTQSTCGSGATCDGSPTTAGTCTNLLGTPCANGTDCASGFCVDGVCCNSACNQACEACAEPGNQGTCVPVVGQPRAAHPACNPATSDPTCGLSCDGVTTAACSYAPTTTACGAPSCAGGTETLTSTCSGTGTCTQPTKACAPYVCGATACLTACGSDADCAADNYCASALCVPVLALGATCSANDQCGSGFCTDGVCCTVASCGGGAACGGATSATPGKCFSSNSTPCKAGTECASGHCTDGVCCDLACDGQCEACDVTGSVGACTPVTGDPHGTARMACDSKAPTDCARATCDGSNRTSCGGFANGGTVPCGADQCTTDGQQLQPHGNCDGAGNCHLPVPSSCGDYACDPTSATCKTTCAADTDCASAYKCDPTVHQCVQGAHCSADGTQSISLDGASVACAPYTCGTDGNCQKQCAMSSDCQAPAVCDTAIGACVVPGTNTTTSSGGCSVDARDRSSSGSASALAALAVVAALARRRRRCRASI